MAADGTAAGGRAPGAETAWRGDDFPAWMSPMLVKELRQGIQSGAFAWTFVLLQAAMFVLMTVWLLERADDALGNSNRFFHGMFWWLFAMAAVAVIPMRAGASMAAERQGLSLDLLRLTRLSATQIVVGKWLATMAQVSLLAVAVLPYVVLQYFFGGLDVISDLQTLLVVVLSASVVTALSVASSGQSTVSRIGVGILTAYASLMLVGTGLSRLSAPGSGSVAAIAVAASLATAVLLEYAAVSVAPPAENHAGRIRAIVIVAALAAIAAPRFVGPVGHGALVTMAWLLAVGVCSAEYTTDPSPVAAIPAAFARFGVPGRIAAFLFTPGWATAVPFTLLAAVLCGIAATSAFTARATPALLATSFAATLFPLPLMVWFPAGRQRWITLILVHVASLAAYLIASSAGGRATDAPARILATLLPVPALFEFTRIGTGSSPPPTPFPPAILVTGLALATSLPRWVREARALAGRLRTPPRRPAAAPAP